MKKEILRNLSISFIFFSSNSQSEKNIEFLLKIWGRRGGMMEFA